MFCFCFAYPFCTALIKYSMILPVLLKVTFKRNMAGLSTCIIVTIMCLGGVVSVSKLTSVSFLRCAVWFMLVYKQFINIYLIADDAKYYTTDDDHTPKSLNTFQEWSDRWLLRLNINKCKIAVCGRGVYYEYSFIHSSWKCLRLNFICFVLLW